MGLGGPTSSKSSSVPNTFTGVPDDTNTTSTSGGYDLGALPTTKGSSGGSYLSDTFDTITQNTDPSAAEAKSKYNAREMIAANIRSWIIDQIIQDNAKAAAAFEKACRGG